MPAFTVRMEKEDHKRLRQLALGQGWSVNQTVLRAVRHLAESIDMDRYAFTAERERDDD